MPAPPQSNDPVPLNVIRLSDAWERYYRATSPDREAIEDELNAAWTECEDRGTGWRRNLEWLGCLTDADHFNAAWKWWHRMSVALEESRSRAEKAFRDALATGHPVALVCNPTSGESLQLNYRDWNKKQSFGVAGFSDDFVDPNELIQPGPNTIINHDGFMRPVFFDLDDFQSCLGLDRVEVVEVSERWSIPEKEPRGPKQAAARRIAKRIWGADGGPPRSLSWQEITNRVNARRIRGDAFLSTSTVERMFKGK
jgi:hypothetical protein